MASRSADLQQILQRLNLDHAIPNFEREKISTDVVCRLSAYQLESLGISNRTEMMKLRTECIKYGAILPPKVFTICGAPKFEIPKSFLQNALENDMQISDISKLLSVSERTVYRRMSEFGLSKMTFSEIDDDNLDLKLGEIVKEFPLCGETMLRQMLILKGIRIQRWRLRDSIHRMDDQGVHDRRTGRLHRRVYDVPGPNYLWHIDTNHKLVRWRFVIVGGIDGFSRLVTFLKCTDNNTSKTILDCFLSGVEKYWIPNKVRSDKGLENVSVADFMLNQNGQNSMITGKSTHNQRIERLWRDVFEGVLSFFYNLFYFMEDQGFLDPLNLIHTTSLHYVFLSEINRKLQFWQEAWARHKLRTVKSSPMSLWTSGQLQHPTGILGSNLQDFGTEGYIDENSNEEESGRPIFQPFDHRISDQCRLELSMEPPRHTINFGIDYYLKCLEIIERNAPTD